MKSIVSSLSMLATTEQNTNTSHQNARELRKVIVQRKNAKWRGPEAELAEARK